MILLIVIINIFNIRRAEMQSSKYLFIIMGSLATFSLIHLAHAGNGANFVLYNHYMPAAGETEIMLMSDIAQEADGTSYTAQMVEVELGINDRLVTEFMFEGQAIGGQGYRFTGFRWEGRYRLFSDELFLNPVIYFEYEDLSIYTKYIMEMSGRSDAVVAAKRRSRERVLESRFILSQDINHHLNFAFNWLNESDLDSGVTAFGYATGVNYMVNESLLFGVELFGGVGDSNKGFTMNGALTQHYLAPNFRLSLSPTWNIKLGGAIGLTNISQDILRFAFSSKF
ncbi:MAG: hypothetical protein Q9M13_02345 [Mariprofundales bacterium]|nr:hypothetical protein [Mariprofundales bacterium]